MITDEKRAELRAAFAALADDPKITEQDVDDLLRRGVPRFQRAVKNIGLGVGVPCGPGRSITEETLSATAKGLAYDNGITPLTVQSFEIANNREHLLHTFAEAGYRQMLFLDSDTVVDDKGVALLQETMERWDAAMVSAPVFQRYVGAEGQFNAFLRDENDKYVPVTRKDIPQSLTAFPVEFCGLAVALLDLTKIKEHPGPRFKRVAEGFQHFGEDIAFCRWLKERELTFVVDPRVTTLHSVNHRFQYSPQTAT